MPEDKDLKHLGQIVKEWTNAIDTLRKVTQGVSIFGSARTCPKDKYYKLAYETCKELSNSGYDIITGGGPGIMEAANRGAMEGKGKSIGLLINIPHEQHSNSYIEKAIPFEYFFTRKITFARFGSVYIVFPGGFGTLDELFEIVTLEQCYRMPKMPIVLMGKSYWQPIFDWAKNNAVKEGLISEQDLTLINITDDVVEAFKIIQKYCKGCEQKRPLYTR